MNNEETMIMQPQNMGANEQNNVSPANPNQNNGKLAAVAAVTLVGGATVGAGAAAVILNDDENPEELVSEVKTEEAVAPAAPSANAAPSAYTSHTAPKHEPIAETIVNDDASEEMATVTIDDQEYGSNEYSGMDYAMHDYEDYAGSDDADEVEVLGVYENEDGQEMALLTDGETVAAVIDETGNGEADELWVDMNQNLEIDEGEVYDVSSEHVQMSQYEDAYMAQQEDMMQQEMLQQEHEAYDYAADNQQDYVNDAPDLSYI